MLQLLKKCNHITVTNRQRSRRYQVVNEKKITCTYNSNGVTNDVLLPNFGFISACMFKHQFKLIYYTTSKRSTLPLKKRKMAESWNSEWRSAISCFASMTPAFTLNPSSAKNGRTIVWYQSRDNLRHIIDTLLLVLLVYFICMIYRVFLIFHPLNI